MENSEKFKKVRAALEMNQEEFGKPLGIKKGQVSAAEKGNSGLSERVIELLILKHGVSRQWWDTGTGDMFRPKGMDDDAGGVFSREDIEMFKHIKDEPELLLAARCLVKIRKEKRMAALRGMMDLVEDGE